METFRIEKYVPMPKATGGRPSKYPFAGMSVGDSFFIAAVGEDCTKKRVSAMAAAASWRQYSQKGDEKIKFNSRKVHGGFRVWRVK